MISGVGAGVTSAGAVAVGVGVEVGMGVTLGVSAIPASTVAAAAVWMAAVSTVATGAGAPPQAGTKTNTRRFANNNQVFINCFPTLRRGRADPLACPAAFLF